MTHDESIFQKQIEWKNSKKFMQKKESMKIIITYYVKM